MKSLKQTDLKQKNDEKKMVEKLLTIVEEQQKQIDNLQVQIDELKK